MLRCNMEKYMMHNMISEKNPYRARRPNGIGGLAGIAFAALLLAGSVTAISVPAAQAKTASPADKPVTMDYVLGPSDVINVIVYGQSEFNITTRIKADGSVVMPLVGKVRAEGRTVLTLADEIESQLKKGGYLRDPIVNVEVREYGSRYVRVAGNVGQPGLFPLDRPYTLLDVLLRSGWVRGSDTVLLRSSDGKLQKINADKLARGELAPITMRPGDTVYVPEGELVYVTGQVRRPGPYRLKPDMTVGELLALAGGVTASGSASKFDVTREGEKQDKVDQQYRPQPGDVINVRERLF